MVAGADAVIEARMPRLAGQSPVYLEKTMLDFKAKRRDNSPAKSSLLRSFEDEQINGMAAMLGGMYVRVEPTR